MLGAGGHQASYLNITRASRVIYEGNYFVVTRITGVHAGAPAITKNACGRAPLKGKLGPSKGFALT